MPKTSFAGGAETRISVDHASSVPLHRQVYNWIRQAILSGQLRPGQRLPATRTLASQLALSRNTISTAYAQLLAEGYLDSTTGYGTIVAKALPETFLYTAANHVPRSASILPTQPAQDNHAPRLSRLGTLFTTEAAAIKQTLPGSLPVATSNYKGQMVAFKTGLPDLDLFPFKLWGQLVNRRLRYSLGVNSGYQEPAGYRPLREALAAHLAVARGVRCQPDQIIIVAGSQAGLDLSARLLLDPGDTAWIEDPAYFGARYALQNAGIRLAPIPVTKEGLDVAAGKQDYPQARLAFVTPSHQFPTGVTMSLGQRLALLEWANQNQAWILEDDYDSEYRFGGRPLEALHGLDRGKRVIYIGTFSKVLFPALRLGYLVVPPELVEVFTMLRRFVDVQPPMLEQMVVADFINEGYFLRHIRRMRQLYKSRRDTLVAAVRKEFGASGELLQVTPPQAGMHLVGWIPPGQDDFEITRQAAAYGVEVSPLSKMNILPQLRGGLILGYAATPEEDILEGVTRLGRLFQTRPNPTRSKLSG